MFFFCAAVSRTEYMYPGYDKIIYNTDADTDTDSLKFQFTDTDTDTDSLKIQFTDTDTDTDSWEIQFTDTDTDNR